MTGSAIDSTPRRSAWRLVRESDPGALRTLVLAQLGSGVSLAVELLLARRVISGLTSTSPTRDNLSALGPTIVVFALLTGISLGTQALYNERLRLAGEIVSHHAIAQVLEVGCRAQQCEMDDPDVHDRLERARQAALFRPAQLVASVGALVGAGLGALAVTVSILIVQPLLVPLIALGAIPGVATSMRGNRKLYAFQRSMAAGSRERLYLQRLLVGTEAAKEVRAFGLGSSLMSRHQGLANQYLDGYRAISRGRQQRTIIGALGLAVALGLAGIAVTSMVAAGWVTVAAAGVSFLGAIQLVGRAQAAGMAVSNLHESATFLADLDALETIGRTADDNENRSVQLAAPFEQVVFDSVGFSYPDASKPVLRGTSLTIGSGEVVALVGENGSGKSTVAKLLVGLYEPSSGLIRWNGTDLRKLDPSTLQAQLSVVFQDFMRYEFTVADNVSLSEPGSHNDTPRIERSARQAGATTFIENLPLGWRTRLGRSFESGVDLSQGQWQMLAIARALYRTSRLLVLDEPGSALDAYADRALCARIFDDRIDGRAVLFITHRLSTAARADRIYVLHEGMIVESGTHDSLMADGGLYAKMFLAQAAKKTQSLEVCVDGHSNAPTVEVTT